MLFNQQFLRRYLQLAPAALAAERTMECQILSQKLFLRPVLDVGCGDGIFAKILFAEKIDTGIDPDSTEISAARELEAYHELIVCGGSEIPKSDGSYRTVFSNSVLEHIADLEPVLREVHRVLAPGGSFFVTIPTDQWEKTVLPARLLFWMGFSELARKYGGLYNSFWKHYRAFSVDDWKPLFEMVGFKVDDVQIYSSANMTTMLDALTPFAAASIISKKTLGRWIPSQRVRTLTASLIFLFVHALMAKFSKEEPRGLVFFSLSK